MSLTLARRTQLMPPSAVREILKVAERPDILSFAGGLPAPELFPVEAIARAHAEVLAKDAAGALQYSTTEGYGPLREWIVRRLASQGLKVEVAQTLITTGSQQGIDLAARVLINPGDFVAVESPSYLAALQAMAGYEAQFVSIPSDDAGMDVDALEEALKTKDVRVIYLVPNFQNPKGTTLVLERRRKLVALAVKHSIAIIEDDPYGELRYRGEAVPSLASMDDAGVVLRLGSFSKTLAPGLRIGFATGPREVIRAMTIAKQAADLHTATLPQRVAAKLLETFDFEGHLATLRKVYGERANAMLGALAATMPPGTRWTNPEGGMFVWLTLPSGLEAQALFAAAIEAHVAFVPGDGFFAGEKRRDCMRLNFSNRPPALIEEGLVRLGRVVHRALDSGWHLGRAPGAAAEVQL
jgi:2-aminoadipate transaminase